MLLVNNLNPLKKSLGFHQENGRRVISTVAIVYNCNVVFYVFCHFRVCCCLPCVLCFFLFHPQDTSCSRLWLVHSCRGSSLSSIGRHTWSSSLRISCQHIIPVPGGLGFHSSVIWAVSWMHQSVVSYLCLIPLLLIADDTVDGRVARTLRPSCNTNRYKKSSVRSDYACVGTFL